MGIVPLLAAALLASSLPAAPPRTSSPNILLIVVDTLRYDALSPSNTPFLHSLQPGSVVFTNAYSTHDFTPPSHFSILTGLPDGLDGADDRPENSVPFQLRAVLNYDTFATAGNSLIRPLLMPTFRTFRRFNELNDALESDMDFWQARADIDARLALFHCPRTVHTESTLYYSAERLLPAFLQQIRSARAPYFGFINLMDTHEPYVPDPRDYPPEKSLPPGFTGDPLHRRLGPELRAPEQIADKARRAFVESKIAEAGSPALVTLDLPRRAVAIYHRRYLARVHETDALLGEFFATLEREHRLDNTYVIITSDHGESFGEADLLSHNFGDRGDYESTHHVPLIIVLPRGRGRGAATATTVTRRVSNASIAPTIYDLARLDTSALRTRFSTYTKSLLPFFAAGPSRYVASVVLPRSPIVADDEAARARERLLRSLGYLQ